MAQALAVGAREQQAAVSLEEPPVIDMAVFLNRADAAVSIDRWQEECRKVAQSFHKFGICIVRDPRVNHEDNESYLDMVESYFEQVS